MKGWRFRRSSRLFSASRERMDSPSASCHPHERGDRGSRFPSRHPRERGDPAPLLLFLRVEQRLSLVRRSGANSEAGSGRRAGCPGVKNTPLALRFSGRWPEKSASADLCCADCTSLCRRRNRRDSSRRPFGHRGPLPPQCEGDPGSAEQKAGSKAGGWLRRLGRTPATPATPPHLPSLCSDRPTRQHPIHYNAVQGRTVDEA